MVTVHTIKWRQCKNNIWRYSKPTWKVQCQLKQFHSSYKCKCKQIFQNIVNSESGSQFNTVCALCRDSTLSTALKKKLVLLRYLGIDSRGVLSKSSTKSISGLSRRARSLSERFLRWRRINLSALQDSSDFKTTSDSAEPISALSRIEPNPFHRCPEKRWIHLSAFQDGAEPILLYVQDNAESIWTLSRIMRVLF